MRATGLAGFGFGDIFDAVDDVFDEIKDVVGDIADFTIDKLDKAFPYLAGVAGGIITMSPQGAITGFKLGSQLFSAHEAREAGEDAEREYARAMDMANYLASAGIDISGNDPAANILINKLREDDYDYRSVESQALITAFVEENRERAQFTQMAYIGAGVIAAGGLLYYLMSRRR